MKRKNKQRVLEPKLRRQQQQQQQQQQPSVQYIDSFDVEVCGELYPEEWEKLSKAAEIHGYGGISRGGKDGIYNILKPSKKRDIRGDTKLYSVYEKLREMRGQNLPEGGIPIKVVAHVPTGERLVGIHYPSDGITIILGMGDYDGEILV